MVEVLGQLAGLLGIESIRLEELAEGLLGRGELGEFLFFDAQVIDGVTLSHPVNNTQTHPVNIEPLF